ncbi:4-hydroxy-3-methylbut-2-en-1-yl diphosphate synthase [Peptostreptococcaceae bacterium oral taxon 113 str. W5053]|nr:4-hydroxy-3-methylbut-2-en-1-yl diphosphate synthase [Peptostreptococcaceae bacterium oral taxon 113 str. W5053]
MRKKTKKIYVGNIAIGGNSPVTIQSMTNTPTQDAKKTVEQILQLENEGCELVRVAVSNQFDLAAIKTIKKNIHIPLIVDIQYDHKLAIESIKAGADCLRINPGNIGDDECVKKIVKTAKEYHISMRIGSNSGSLSKKFLEKYQKVCSDAIVESAIEQIHLLESMEYYEMKLSLKSSSVPMTMECYEKISKLCDYPLHLGITEAGPGIDGIIKSSIGIGGLLSQGIGDTIRVSLTDAPIEEVKVGKKILKSLDLYHSGINLISCPTCSRTKIDLIEIVNKAYSKLEKIDASLTIAIMGCPVNGPGEAREADYGIAGENGKGIIFKKGHIIRRVDEDKLLDGLLEEIEKGL